MSIRSLPKSALAALAACGISVASTAPTTSPTFTPPTLTQRIDTVRSKLMALEAAAVAPQELGAQRQAQLFLQAAGGGLKIGFARFDFLRGRLVAETATAVF